MDGLPDWWLDAERHSLLAPWVFDRPRLQVIQHVERRGEALFYAIAVQDFEGIVAKRADAL